jgi:hypothetical protein
LGILIARLLLNPKFSMSGEPKLESKGFKFDHVFGPARSNVDVFDAIGAPLAVSLEQLACLHSEFERKTLRPSLNVKVTITVTVTVTP